MFACVVRPETHHPPPPQKVREPRGWWPEGVGVGGPGWGACRVGRAVVEGQEEGADRVASPRLSPRLGSQERDRVAPWHEGGEAAEDTMSIGLPEVSATAELRREAGGSRRNVQACDAVQDANQRACTCKRALTRASLAAGMDVRNERHMHSNHQCAHLCMCMQVCATVQEMDTAVTHRMLNQVILLHSKLQREV